MGLFSQLLHCRQNTLPIKTGKEKNKMKWRKTAAVLSLLLALSILLGIVILFAFIMYYIKIFRGKYGLKTPRQP